MSYNPAERYLIHVILLYWHIQSCNSRRNVNCLRSETVGIYLQTEHKPANLTTAIHQVNTRYCLFAAYWFDVHISQVTHWELFQQPALNIAALSSTFPFQLLIDLSTLQGSFSVSPGGLDMQLHAYRSRMQEVALTVPACLHDSVI